MIIFFWLFGKQITYFHVSLYHFLSPWISLFLLQFTKASHFPQPKEPKQCLSVSEYSHCYAAKLLIPATAHTHSLSLSLSLSLQWPLLLLLSISPLSPNLLRGTSPSLPIHQPFAYALVSHATILEFELPVMLPKWLFAAPLPLSQVCLVPHLVRQKGYNFIWVLSSFLFFENWVVFNFCFF